MEVGRIRLISLCISDLWEGEKSRCFIRNGSYLLSWANGLTAPSFEAFGSAAYLFSSSYSFLPSFPRCLSLEGLMYSMLLLISTSSGGGADAMAASLVPSAFVRRAHISQHLFLFLSLSFVLDSIDTARPQCGRLRKDCQCFHRELELEN